jgi:hypothetical protein
MLTSCGVVALNKDSEKRARINLECSAVEVHRALGWVLRPEKVAMNGDPTENDAVL